MNLIAGLSTYITTPSLLACDITHDVIKKSIILCHNVMCDVIQDGGEQ